MSTIDQILQNTDTQDEFLRELMSVLVTTTRTSNTIPKGLDYDFLQSYPENRKLTDEASNKAKGLLSSLLSLTSKSKTKAVALSDDMTDSYFYDQVADTIDALLDQASTALNSQLASNKSESFVTTAKQSLHLNKERILQENVKDIPKPQDAFLPDIDNLRTTPFKPKMKTKYHQREEYKFEERVLLEEDEDNENEVANPDIVNTYFPHPYEYELLNLEFPAWLVSPLSSDFIISFPDPNRPCQFIDKEKEFFAFIQELSKETLIAIDLEHHSFRSFQGLTCLMQISSLHKDYIIDTLALRLVMEKLGIIFADPKIVKVLHGCEQDVLWMQRDFGLYLVNAFDTYLAGKELSFPSNSLQHLVKYYCNVELDKTHQLSDWRQRKLSQEMLTYAKFDTHYLLFIFYCLLKDLWKLTTEEMSIGSNLKASLHTTVQISPEKIEKVLYSTRKLCLQRYEKPVFDPLGYKKLFSYAHLPKTIPKLHELSSIQESCLSLLYNWRDEHARSDDESLDYVMSNAELLRLGIKIPQSMEQIDSCAPLSSYVLNHKLSLLKVFLDLVNINPVHYLQNQKQRKANLDNHKLHFQRQEEDKFSTLFTMIPTVPDDVINNGPSIFSGGKEDYFSTPPLSLDEVRKSCNLFVSVFHNILPLVCFTAFQSSEMGI
jgi:exosome complex exonuclease RRP6